VTPEIVKALEPVVKTFEKLGVPYAIGGSMASSALGVARSTLDADIVADLCMTHVEPLFDLLHKCYYLDPISMREAIENESSFNLIHLATMLKVDVFVLKKRHYDRQSFLRRLLKPISEDRGAKPFYLVAPEDVILNKLMWYRAGSETTERQWNDVWVF